MRVPYALCGVIITTLTLRVDESSADHGRQLVLGDAPAGEVELEVVMSRLQSALGEEALFSAVPLATHRPEEAWTMTPVSLSPAGERVGVRADPRSPTKEKKAGVWPKRKAKTEQHGVISLPTLETRPPRLFKEPSRLNAELSTEGALVTVTLAGKPRQVEALTGPERLVGAWWSPDPFSRDYYRLQLEGVGQLWVFRDGKDGAFYAQGVFD